MENGSQTPTETKGPKALFDADRGERATYEAADPNTEVLLPITRDGYEAMIECALKPFGIPVDDSIRGVFSGYVHHIANEKNKVSIAQIGAVLYKSISNALTYEIDQEIKMKRRIEFQEQQAKAKAEADEKAKQEAIAKRELKQAKKANRRVTVKQKPNETEMS